MSFFVLDDWFKIIFYWIGIILCLGSIMGWILLLFWSVSNWGDGIESLFKYKKEGSKLTIINKELKGVEKLFLILGFFAIPIALFLIL